MVVFSWGGQDKPVSDSSRIAKAFRMEKIINSCLEVLL